MDELIARFTLEKPEEIKTVFSVNFTPSKVSQLENNLNYITQEEFTDGLATKQPLGDYASKSDIPDVSNFLTPEKLGIAKIIALTQADYDALATKEANTLYLIEEENA